jgi:hypothetical protein
VSSSKRPKILLSRSFISEREVRGAGGPARPAGEYARAVPMVKFGAVHVHQARGLGGSLGHGSSPRDRVRVLDIRVLDAPCP